MPKLEEQILVVTEKLELLKLRQRRIDARKTAIAAVRERKVTMRRKILLGGVVLAKLDQGQIAQQQLRDWLDQELARADDRALFDLPPRR